MGSIPKVVLTPVKWVSKKLLHRTLLRFPQGKEKDPIACTYCPEMCRFSCPVAVVSGDDTVTPRGKMSLLHQEERWPGRVSQGGPLWPIYDCTGCGRCSTYCKYDIPVADFLFEARATYPWDRAVEVARSLTDLEDPVGDLAEELGAREVALARLKAFRASQGGEHAVLELDEPRSVYFAGKEGASATLAWQPLLMSPADDDRWVSIHKRLAGARWLLAESVWCNRRLGRSEQMRLWVERARAQGCTVVLPFGSGEDCLDSGGEGAFARLFPEQAAQMARDFWERDRHRAEGILVVSPRAAQHFRKVLGLAVPVISFSELFHASHQSEGGRSG